ncbi:MAG: VWA domain-containing protein, partial [Clostridia bacterium]|nr:VWA domain-containing protein [Clostridia bacterium]
MIDELNDDDRFGMVLFDDGAYLGKPLSLIGDTDIKEIKEHILDIEARGGTNFEAGYKKGTDLFDKEILNDKEYDNRIIVITDAMPNVGTTNKSGLLKYIESNSKNGIYTSFIGVGVDFNTEVIESLSN